MYKIDIQKKPALTELSKVTFAELELKERSDIQEWIADTPGILGEDFLIIAKEYPLPSGIRLDLLAIDKQANLVVIELKRDESGSKVDWQSIKYASYCSNFTHEKIYLIYADYLKTDAKESALKIEEFIDEELEKLNESQRIILVSKEFHSDVVSAVLWLRDFGVEIQCVKLEPFRDLDKNLFINSSIIIPLPEAKDYIKRKEIKTKEKTLSNSRSISFEIPNFGQPELKKHLIRSFSINDENGEILRIFFRILLSEKKKFKREEIKKKLHEEGIGEDMRQTGQLLGNRVSKPLTSPNNGHLRQVLSFTREGYTNDTKTDYYILNEYRDLVLEVLGELDQALTPPIN